MVLDIYPNENMSFLGCTTKLIILNYCRKHILLPMMNKAGNRDGVEQYCMTAEG